MKGSSKIKNPHTDPHTAGLTKKKGFQEKLENP